MDWKRFKGFLQESNGQLSSMRLSLLFTVAIEIGLVLPTVTVVWVVQSLGTNPPALVEVPATVIGLVTTPVAVVAGIKLGQKFGEKPPPTE